MGKTRDLFKKIRDTKGTFHIKMGTIQETNGKDLTESEEIKRRCQDYTEELYKKCLMTWIITMVVTYLEPDILESEVKWALGALRETKQVEVTEFLLSYFKSQKCC